MNEWDRIRIKEVETGAFLMGFELKKDRVNLRSIMSLHSLIMRNKSQQKCLITTQSITFAMPTPTGGGTPPSVVYYMIPSQIRNFKKPTLFDLNIPLKRIKT